MNILQNTSATISLEELKEILNSYLKDRGYKVNGAILPNIKKWTNGYGPMERDNEKFVGISVNLKKL